MMPDEPYDYDPASDNGTSDDFNDDNTPGRLETNTREVVDACNSVARQLSELNDYVGRHRAG